MSFILQLSSDWSVWDDLDSHWMRHYTLTLLSLRGQVKCEESLENSVLQKEIFSIQY